MKNKKESLSDLKKELKIVLELREVFQEGVKVTGNRIRIIRNRIKKKIKQGTK